MSKPQKKVKPKQQIQQFKQPQKSFKDTVKRELKYILRGEKRLTADFLGSITIILVTVLVIVSLALMKAVQEFDKELALKTNDLRNSISSNLLSTIEN